MKNEKETLVKLKDTTANPAPLGLICFGMTTILLNLHNAGLFGLDSMVLSLGIFMGGIGQIIAGIMEWKKNNTFGATAFLSYGLFWLSLAGSIVFPAFNWREGPIHATMASYMLMWALFTFVMFFATLKINVALQFVFGSLTILYALLALNDISGLPFILRIAGVEGILCGLSAVYAGLAQVLNEVYGKTVWPIYPVK